MQINKKVDVLSAYTKKGDDWYLRIQINDMVYSLPIKQETLDFLTRSNL